MKRKRVLLAATVMLSLVAAVAGASGAGEYWPGETRS